MLLSPPAEGRVEGRRRGGGGVVEDASRGAAPAILRLTAEPVTPAPQAAIPAGRGIAAIWLDWLCVLTDRVPVSPPLGERV